ncbi:MAG: ArsC/Spx/MgsR family protein, partial [Pseudomonadota bacterium]
MTLHGLKTCDTCRKALKALEAAGSPVTFRDVRAGPVTAGELAAWHAAFGAALINTRSTTWRGLDAAQRARAEGDVAALLVEHPTLIKRPVIEADGQLYLGWTKATQAALG